MNDKQKQLIDIATLIKECVYGGIETGKKHNIIMLTEVSREPHEIISLCDKETEKVIAKMCERWIPKTDIMQGDVVK